ncbi:hypothetical protein AMATHDRAFT_67649 [Amanita thiersii Skay4041]|uniref:DUF6699 domain-containing protein n=1 Tax=Amanita thiersii Skay4041 TaxID=703135 RepID=A0A2A9NGX2_9AGAR|nr:hypothetical protein AMATHDRAFT_67649 [Amanita thiersii Skay4041]
MNHLLIITSSPTRRSFQLSTIPSLPHDHVSPSSTSGIQHATELVFASPYWPSPSQHQARQAQSTSQSSSIHIHPLLSYFPYQSSLQYDVTMPPDIPTPYQLELQSPATEPPVFYMALSSKLLPWLIEISTSSSERYINVSDVLDTIYHELQRPITLAEYDALGSVVRERINWAFISRCANIGDPSEQDKERNKGVKRVDFLRDRNRFTGLSTSAVNSDYWEVHLR